MDAVASPLLSTTNQPDPRILPLITDSEFLEERWYSSREEWILFFHFPSRGPSLALRNRENSGSGNSVVWSHLRSLSR